MFNNITTNDMLFVIPMAILYNAFFHRLGLVLFKDLIYEEKYKKNIMFLFAVGVIGIITVYILSKKYKEYTTDKVNAGIIIGSICLILSSIINNWNNMQDMYKLLLVGICLVAFIWHTQYNYNLESDDVEDNNNKEIKDK